MPLIRHLLINRRQPGRIALLQAKPSEAIQSLEAAIPGSWQSETHDGTVRSVRPMAWRPAEVRAFERCHTSTQASLAIIPDSDAIPVLHDAGGCGEENVQGGPCGLLTDV
jgi:hypothetical protein